MRVETPPFENRADERCTSLAVEREFGFIKIRLFGENIAALSSRPKKTFWDAKTLIGATIHGLAKYYMYQFHYGTMRFSLDCRLLHGDINSLIYRFNSENLYRDLREINFHDQFDFLNYAKDHDLYSKANKRAVLNFKDKIEGDFKQEFICLKPKLSTVTPLNECYKYLNKRII